MTDLPARSRRIVDADPHGRTIWPILGIVGGAAVAVFSVVSGLWAGAAIGGAASAGSGLLGRKNLAAAVRWKAPQLVLPMVSLQMETPLEIHYRRRSRKVTDVAAAELRLTLVCQEHVQWEETGTDSDGNRTTDTRHQHAEVYRAGVVGSVEGTPDGLDGVAWLTVPATAGCPSFDEGNNDVKWWIDAELHGGDMPKDRHRFHVVVLPELGDGFQPRHGRGIQDS